MTASFPSPEQSRRLRLQSSRLVSGFFAGEYRSVFRGRGIEFETVREYQPGDDVRCIDWNVTARCGRPFLKQFVEERELNLMLLVDRSASLASPTPRGARSRLAAEAAALLTFAAARSNDRVGLISCSDRMESFIPPAKGARQAQRIVASLGFDAPSGRGTDLSGALDFFSRVSRRSGTLCIVSDFICPDFSRELAAVARRHEVMALVVTDPNDIELPQAGLLDLADEESGRRTLVDCSNKEVRLAYREGALARRARLLQGFASAGVKHLELSTARPPLHDLVRFFQGHRRQGRR
jgi:uncharacterized protein (DUF58 family)